MLTKKAIKNAPRFILSTDYKATYKPLTIFREPLKADNLVAAMLEADSKFTYDTYEEQVWCLIISEKTDVIENVNGEDAIVYEERIESGMKDRWYVIRDSEFYQLHYPQLGGLTEINIRHK